MSAYPVFVATSFRGSFRSWGYHRVRLIRNVTELILYKLRNVKKDEQ